MTNEEFEKITAQSVKELPDFFKNKMENVVIIVRSEEHTSELQSH